ncbi:MAG: phosphoglycerate dehydrogenase [Phycisphaeraceae bacterium]
MVPDKLADEGLDYVRAQPDVELTSKPGITEAELAPMVGDYDGLIVRSGIQVTAAVLAKPGRLKAIARAGVGVDNIDLDAATEHGILVMNSAEASTISTAEHAFSLLMALARQIGPAYKKMAEGGWDRNKFMGTQLSGKTLGVVGFGRIGRTVAERALAFGMTVVAYDPFINAGFMMDGKVRMFASFEELAPNADLLTFHVPLNEQTKGMLGVATFAKVRKGVLVINAARGGVVDEAALLAALDSGQCGGAALDVFDQEPPPADSPLRKHPRLLVTPHLGASTHEAQQAVSIAAAEQLLEYLRGQGVRGAVNAGGLRVDLSPLQNKFVDLVQRMAALINPMVTRGIAGVTFEIAGKELAAVAGTIERFGLVGLLKGYLAVPVNMINVRHIAEQRGIRLRTVISEGEEKGDGPQLAMEITGPSGAVDDQTPHGDESRRIVGKVYQDMRPRVVEINRYHMDMVPAGHMVLIQNEDRPGMIGMVGSEFGSANVNIADMTISRRTSAGISGGGSGGTSGGATALMVLKVDAAPPESLLNRLKARPGILKVAAVKLPDDRQ